MTDTLDSFVAQMQNEIIEQTRQEFGEAFYTRWMNPTHMGILATPSAHAELTGECGDQISTFLDIEDESIRKATFQTTGCGPSIVSADAACELAEGRSLEEAAGMEQSDVISLLGFLPADKEHCAHLAARTIREAIRLYWLRQDT
ncbi:MAG: iron-sulfur cluster assembly scaffold protein [Desulfovermiculus sp.]|nr:iron-sulfur cluster assembly scaffold protein [Desulfovermiculus sp.]